MDPIAMLHNLDGQLAVFWPLLMTIAALAGFTLAGIGVWKVMAAKQQREGVKIGVVTILIGALLVSLQSILNSVTLSTFGQDSRSTLDYSAGGDPFGIFVTVGVKIVILVGLYGALKGMLLLRASGEDPRQFWRGVTHLGGGVAAINIDLLAHALGQSLGGGLDSVITRIMG